jgi:calcineurin-like phosphoesterase family protein
MNVFFTGDTHFGDHRVLNIRPRPFDSLDEMNETLIARWNARVRAEDDIWHLGDFASGLKLAQLVLPKLNGRKHLVPGNNDPEAVGRLEWTSVQRFAEVVVEGTMLVLCHYPFRSWNRMHRGSVNLHGHSHGRLRPLKHQFDVGVDARGFTPILLSELLSDPQIPD